MVLGGSETICGLEAIIHVEKSVTVTLDKKTRRLQQCLELVSMRFHSEPEVRDTSRVVAIWRENRRTANLRMVETAAD